MKHYRKQKQGFSLVETLVAISVLLIAAVGPITIAAQAMQSAQYTRQQNTATFLAQEGVEALVAIRNNGILPVLRSGSGNALSWVTGTNNYDSCFVGDGCGIDFRDSSLHNNVTNCSTNINSCNIYFDPGDTQARYSHVSSDAEATIYNRRIRLQQYDRGGYTWFRVESIVSWTARSGEEKEVRATTFLHELYND